MKYEKSDLFLFLLFIILFADFSSGKDILSLPIKSFSTKISISQNFPQIVFYLTKLKLSFKNVLEIVFNVIKENVFFVLKGHILIKRHVTNLALMIIKQIILVLNVKETVPFTQRHILYQDVWIHVVKNSGTAGKINIYLVVIHLVKVGVIAVAITQYVKF